MTTHEEVSAKLLRIGLKPLPVSVPIRRYLPPLLVGLSLSLIMVGAFAVASPTHAADRLLAGSGRPLVHDSSHGQSQSFETGIAGNISIYNVSLACSYPGTVPSPSTTIKVVVTAQSGVRTFVPVIWLIINTCVLYGTFQAGLSRGTYSLTLSYCLQSSGGAGCGPEAPPGYVCVQSCFLPISVTVEPEKLTPVNIGITAGIA